MNEQPIGIGMIGFGVVGGGAYQVLTENQHSIELKVGSPLEVKLVADLAWDRPRPLLPPADRRTTDPWQVVNHPGIQVVVECIGGVEPARELVLAALSSGKSVVTSNKELIAKHGREILELAGQRGVDICFEASVGGGMPIINPLKVSLAANRIERVIGIVNGTTNYILSRMFEQGQDFAQALAEAQQKGYAEPDPTNDIEGFDAAYKLAILASIAFGSRAAVTDIYHEGITRLSARDMQHARELGYTVKLLAIGADTPDGLELRVHPTFLPRSHPLAGVNGVLNAVYLEGSAVGPVMFYGRGAGARPTGSAVVADVMEVARNLRKSATGRIPCTCFEERPVKPIEQVSLRYYLRLEVVDRPGVLAAITGVFGEENVSLSTVLQKSQGEVAELVLVTHQALEANMRRSLDRLERLAVVSSICNWVRLEEP